VQELPSQEPEVFLDVSALSFPAERKRTLRSRSVPVEMMESVAVSYELLAQFVPELESILPGIRPCVLRDVDDIPLVVISGMNVFLRNVFSRYGKDWKLMNWNAQPLLQIPYLTYETLRGWERPVSVTASLHNRPIISPNFFPQRIQCLFKSSDERISFDLLFHIAVLF
jgi:hypothetical protein